MLIYSMGVSVDGFIADRDGEFEWTVPSDELFRFHTTQVRELGGYLLGRRLYETMLPWETDPSMREDELRGNARLAEGSVAEEIAAALETTDRPVSIGGAGLAASAVELGLVDEFRIFRNPIVVGGGTPFLPPVTQHLRLEMVETRTFSPRVIYERYRRVRDDSA
jgi:dihydrofolate reductase